MDLANYSSVSSVSTQTPTEDRTFEFPDVFSTSPATPRSSIGTQTESRRRLSYEDGNMIQHRPRLFRRHSTGSDVYNFSTSPTLLTACGTFGNRGLLSGRMLPADPRFMGRRPVDKPSPLVMGTSAGSDAAFAEEDDDAESVGQQLRRIGDDLERGGKFRTRSLSVSHFLASVRRRTSSSSS